MKSRPIIYTVLVSYFLFGINTPTGHANPCSPVTIKGTVSSQGFGFSYSQHQAELGALENAEENSKSDLKRSLFIRFFTENMCRDLPANQALKGGSCTETGRPTIEYKTVSSEAVSTDPRDPNYDRRRQPGIVTSNFGRAFDACVEARGCRHMSFDARRRCVDDCVDMTTPGSPGYQPNDWFAYADGKASGEATQGCKFVPFSGKKENGSKNKTSDATEREVKNR